MTSSMVEVSVGTVGAWGHPPAALAGKAQNRPGEGRGVRVRVGGGGEWLLNVWVLISSVPCRMGLACPLGAWAVGS